MLEKLRKIGARFFGKREQREVSDGSVPLRHRALEAELNKTPSKRLASEEEINAAILELRRPLPSTPTLH